MDFTTDKGSETHEVASFKVDDHRAVEVHRSDAGEYWVGLTTIRDPRDWSFSPREQYGKGERGLSMAMMRAESWARELSFDAAQ